MRQRGCSCDRSRHIARLMGSSLLSTLLLLLVGALLARLTANRLKDLALPAINLVLQQTEMISEEWSKEDIGSKT